MTATRPPAGARSSAASAALAAALAIGACAPASDADDPAVVPPLAGQEATEAWLAEGHYLAWTCQPAPHDPIALSPHGRARACANPVAASLGPARVDAAYVLEIFEGAAAAPAGHGVQRRTLDGDDGDAWYWYMRVPPASATIHDATGLAADGWGFGDGPAATYCTPCHRSAGNGQPGAAFVFVVP